MADITLKGNPFHTCGALPAVGAEAPDCELLKGDLSVEKLSAIGGKRVLNIFPSIDTPVCATSVRTFNERAAAIDGVTVVNVSMDLPFAQGRFCAAEGIEGVQNRSAFRSEFADAYGVRIVDGPLAGLCARAIVVLGGDGKVVHSELVPEIAQEPNYEAAIAAVK